MATFERILPVLFVTFLITGMFSASAHADTMECVLKETAGNVVVRGAQTLKPVATLKPGDHVYERWPSPPDFFIISRGKFVEVDGLADTQIDCDGSGRSGEYPVVFQDDAGTQDLFREFGILNKFACYYTNWDVLRDKSFNETCRGVPKQAHNCFSAGAGHLGIDLIDEAYAKYRRKNFNFDALCMALTSGQLRFDPSTGERLPTYVMIQHIKQDDGKVSTFISDELPFYVPSCFAKGRITKENLGATLRPLGCTVGYHPWSGRKLSPGERRFFTREASLRVAGDAGDSTEDSQNLAQDSNRAATAAKIEAIKKSAASK